MSDDAASFETICVREREHLQAQGSGSDLVGLAFSGGGIRSATLCLGALQGLARLRFLARVDYLSTVSGGGYVGGFLEAWLYRCHFEQRLDALERRLEALGGALLAPDPERPLRERIAHLSGELAKIESALPKAASARAAAVPMLTVLDALPKLDRRLAELEAVKEPASPGPIPAPPERRPLAPIELLEEKLRTNARRRAGEPELGPLRFLREYSNYLTPQPGLFTADAWTVGAIYLRNLALNAIVLILTLGALLLAIRGLVRLHVFAEAWLHDSPGPWAILCAAVAAVCGSCALGVSVLVLGRSDITREAERLPSYLINWLAPKRPVYRGVIFPLLIGSAVLSLLLRCLKDYGQWRSAVQVIVLAALLYALAWMLAFKYDSTERDPVALAGGQGAAPPPAKKSSAEAGLSAIDIFVSAFLASCLGSAVMFGLAHVLHAKSMNTEANAVYGTSLILASFGVVLTAQTGFAGRGLSEYVREWGSRLVAHLWLWAAGLSALTAIAVHGPELVDFGTRRLNAWIGTGLTLGWIGTTLGALWSVRKEARGAELSWVRRLLITIAPPVFSLGALLLLAVGVRHCCCAFSAERLGSLFEASTCRAYGTSLEDVHLGATQLLVAAVAALAAGLFSWRIGVNEFSLHALYRNRLVRCYLGAVRGNDRGADLFTGFDMDDDSLRLDELSVYGASRGHAILRPFWLINATLNLVAGQKLAWQFRRASSFVFTPLYSGYEPRHEAPPGYEDVLSKHAYRPTSRYGGGIRLGTAVAISGAALSPNMGARTSPAMAFLMTLFNVRLGWWLGNPRNKVCWTKAGPTLGLVHLLTELLGMASDARKYVYLSDGGHFENLGIYELVRRRCRYIVACDGGEDRDLGFSDLGNAVEKCRTDFGVEIEIDITPLKPHPETGLSERHFVVGVIRYGRGNGHPAEIGTLVYLKSSITGDEPVDVQTYRRAHPEFPHQSSTDQWFDEAQFESYRALGEHIALSAFDLDRDTGCHGLDTETLFVTLRQRSFGPAATQALFTKHGEVLCKVFEQLQTKPELRYLDAQIYPAWSSLTQQAAHLPGQPPTPQAPVHMWLPRDAAELRTGFYFCQQLIQLMENVYLDLELDATYDHPDLRGWMNLFHHWSWCGMFRVTWAIVAGTTGTRFQDFCQRRIGLDDPTALDAIELTVTEPAPSLEALTQGPALRLNFLETQLLGELQRANHGPERTQDGPEHSWRVFSTAMKVSDPAGSGQSVSFPVSFGLIRDDKLVYLRTQDHLRKTGLARTVLGALLERRWIDGCDRIRYEGLSEAVRDADWRNLAALFKSVHEARTSTRG